MCTMHFIQRIAGLQQRDNWQELQASPHSQMNVVHRAAVAFMKMVCMILSLAIFCRLVVSSRAIRVCEHKLAHSRFWVTENSCNELNVALALIPKICTIHSSPGQWPGLLL